MLTLTKTNNQENVVLNFVKGLIISMVASFAMILIFALFIKWFSIKDGLIFPVVMIIKAVSTILGALIAIRGNNGLIKGSIFGAIYIIFAFFIFSALTGSFSFDINNFLDTFCSIIVGGITGIFKVNAK